MGTTGPTTARGQVAEAARLLDLYMRQIEAKGTTTYGWGSGRPKETNDHVTVTPATDAVACLFAYTPYVGAGWGGSAGGVYLFYAAWVRYGFFV
jgi:hypothetical protein